MNFQRKNILFLISIALTNLALHGANFLIWVCFVPLFILIPKLSWKESLVYGALFGLGTSFFLNFPSAREKIIYFQLAGVWSLFFTILVAGSKIIYKKTKKEILFILFPGVFLFLAQQIKIGGISLFFLNFSTLQPQLAPLIWFIGASGISSLMLCTNALIASTAKKRTKLKIALILILILALGASTIYSFRRDYNNATKQIKVATVQIQIDKTWKWRTNHINTIAKKYIEQSLKLKDYNPDLVVWPEYALPTDIKDNPQLQNKLTELSSKLNSTLIVGTIKSKEGELHTDSAAIFDQGKLIDIYDAQITYPRNERTVANPDSKDIYKTSAGKFSINICYEEITAGIVRKKIQDIDYLIFLANNQALRTKTTKSFGLSHPTLRSAENKTFGIRSSNLGYSAVISPTGKIIKKTRGKILKSKILLMQTQESFYAKHGDLILWIFVVIYSTLLGLTLKLDLGAKNSNSTKKDRRENPPAHDDY